MPVKTAGIGEDGPLVAVAVLPGEAHQDALRQKGEQVPHPLRITALVDTGASHTFLDHSVCEQLKLTPVGDREVANPYSQEKLHTQEYVATIILGEGNTALHVRNLRTLALPLTSGKFQCLLGRDVLQKCLLTYDGTTACFTLAY